MLKLLSNTVFTKIGNKGDAPNTVTSVVTVAQLGVILPAITGIVAANEEHTKRISMQIQICLVLH